MIKAIRGAYSIEKNTKEELEKKTFSFLDIFFKVNKIKINRIVQIIVSSTDDIRCDYPCKYFRKYGVDVPLMCIAEQDVDNGTPLIVRVLFLIRTFKKLKPVYIGRAKTLRKFN